MLQAEWIALHRNDVSPPPPPFDDDEEDEDEKDGEAQKERHPPT